MLRLACRFTRGVAPQKVLPVGLLPIRQNRGRKSAQNETAAETLLNHPVGKGLGKHEIAGFALP